MDKIYEKVLSILESNCDATNEQIAVMLDMKVDEIDKIIKKLKDDMVILGNKCVINWEKTDREFVTASIELKVTPQRGDGFEKIAERIYQYPEVKSLYLMAGTYDLNVIIEGKTLQDVSSFVATKLAPMECVMSTATHFVLKKYKDDGVIYADKVEDGRQVITI